jgi:hypothetical protein
VNSTPTLARRKNRRGGATGGDSGQAKIGRIVEIDAGQAEVVIDDRTYSARSTRPIAASDIGKEAVVVFACGRVRQAIIIGVLRQPEAETVTARMDGDRLVLSATKEIVLECGDASITLTRAGKVLIRGAYVLSKSSGVNRIKGGSVQIN